jgi:hypothetical protein
MTSRSLRRRRGAGPPGTAERARVLPQLQGAARVGGALGTCNPAQSARLIHSGSGSVITSAGQALVAGRIELGCQPSGKQASNMLPPGSSGIR